MKLGIDGIVLTTTDEIEEGVFDVRLAGATPRDFAILLVRAESVAEAILLARETEEAIAEEVGLDDDERLSVVEVRARAGSPGI